MCPGRIRVVPAEPHTHEACPPESRPNVLGYLLARPWPGIVHYSALSMQQPQAMGCTPTIKRGTGHLCNNFGGKNRRKHLLWYLDTLNITHVILGAKNTPSPPFPKQPRKGTHSRPPIHPSVCVRHPYGTIPLGLVPYRAPLTGHAPPHRRRPSMAYRTTRPAAVVLTTSAPPRIIVYNARCMQESAPITAETGTKQPPYRP